MSNRFLVTQKCQLNYNSADACSLTFFCIRSRLKNIRCQQMASVNMEVETKTLQQTDSLGNLHELRVERAFDGIEVEDDTGKNGKSTFSPLLRAKLLLIGGFFEEKWLKYRNGGNKVGRCTRIYQVWPGKNVFFFHGRLVCGPDPRGLLVTAVTIVLSSCLFMTYIISDLPHHSSLVLAFFMVLTILVLGNLILVSTIDPGIIPRNDQVPDICSGDTRQRKTVMINGVEVQLKLCRICKILRPPRSCHCVICDNCVERFDHHCPWVGQCIALRNHRFYLSFVTLALLFFIYILTFSFWRIHRRILRPGFGLLHMLRDYPETLALIAFSLAAVWFLGSLASFHLYLIAKNQTAYEYFRQRFASRGNPHDGGMMKNIIEILFTRIPPSKVNFRAEVGQMTPAGDLVCEGPT